MKQIPNHSVRSLGSVNDGEGGEGEDMAGDKEEDIDDIKSAEEAIVEKEGEEKEEEARNIRGK